MAVSRATGANTRHARNTRRLDMVLRELRKRAANHPAPHLIGRAIEGLEAELAAVRRQLGQR